MTKRSGGTRTDQIGRQCLDVLVCDMAATDGQEAFKIRRKVVLTQSWLLRLATNFFKTYIYTPIVMSWKTY